MTQNFLMLKKVPTNKTEQKNLASQFVEAVKNGDINPIDAVVQMKSVSEAISNFLKDSEVVDAVVNECYKYGRGENPSYCGASVTVKETGVKYDYSACKDPLWDELNAQIAELKSQLKERETYLHALSSSKTEIDEESGEIFTLYPPVRTSVTTYAITFKK